MHCFHPDPNRGQRTILVQIAETEMRFAGCLNDLLDDTSNESIVSTLEVGELDGNKAGVASDKFCRPEFVV